MITVKESHKDGNKIVVEMEIPDEWYTILLDYQKKLGHDTLDQTIESILMNYINDKEVERKQEEITFKEVCAMKDKIEDDHNKARAAINKRLMEKRKKHE